MAAFAVSLVPAVAMAAAPGTTVPDQAGTSATAAAVSYVPPAYQPPAPDTVAYLPPAFVSPAAHAVAYVPPAYQPPAPDTVAYLPPAFVSPASQAVAFIPPAYEPPAPATVAYLPPAYAPAPGGATEIASAAGVTAQDGVGYVPPAYVAPTSAAGGARSGEVGAAQQVAYIPPAYEPPAGMGVAAQTVSYIPPAYRPPLQFATAQPAIGATATRQAVAFQPKVYPQVFHPAKAVYYPRWEWCVPFARDVSGIKVVGNAKDWWYNAAGHYARGHRPEPGAVLDFRGIPRMPLGHVSVVMSIVNTREILIEHANWGGPGSNHSGISRNIAVIDVSPNNDWTAVRVGLGPRYPGQFGSVYPTYGFIYDRPDNGVILANTHPAPTVRRVEVAEAPPSAAVASQPMHHSLLDLGGGSR
ncbi:MAG: hypothetical protein KGK10_05130 [Rhodospirillales bacterium]|nr:hypothetical protein [Rhodospirillales bacterium]